MSKVHITPAGELKVCKAKVSEDCLYYTKHGNSAKELQTTLDTINENVVSYTERLSKVIGDQIRGIDVLSEGPYGSKRIMQIVRDYLIIESNNLNILSGDTEASSFLNGYNKHTPRKKFTKLENDVLKVIKKKNGGKPDHIVTYQDVVQEIKRELGIFNFMTYKSGNKIADEFARHPGVNCESAGLDFSGISSLYSCQALSCGSAAKYKDEVNSDNTTPLITNINKIFKNKGDRRVISKIFRINKDPNTILVFMDEREDIYSNSDKTIFITTEDKLLEDVKKL